MFVCPQNTISVISWEWLDIFKKFLKDHVNKCSDKTFPWVWLDWQKKVDDRRDRCSEIIKSVNWTLNNGY